MKINSNIAALYANRSLERSTQRADNSMLRLSTGSKINSVKDDAAGTAISTKLRSQINALNMSSRNSMDGVSLVQTAEGALGEIHDMLKRMRELSVQAANGTLEDADRANIQSEVASLTEEITAISERTEYNKQNLLNRDLNDLKLQIGGSEGMEMDVCLLQCNATTLGIDQAVCLLYTSATPFDTFSTTTTSALSNTDKAILIYDKAIADVSTFRASLGAYQNRLEHAITSLDNSSVNASQSLSRVADTDMAIEMSEYTKANVISQAATAMLAQANTRPEQMLQLLR